MLSCALQTKGFCAASSAEFQDAEPSPYLNPSFTTWDQALLDPAVTAALHQVYGGKAYGLTYTTPQDPDLRPYRLRKESLTDGSRTPADVPCILVPVDVDNPGHEPWESAEAARAAVEAFPAYPGLTPAIVHSTKHGLHAWYVLAEPVAPDVLEVVIRGIQHQLQLNGVKVDLKASDWTRLTSLPDRTLPDYYERTAPEARVDPYEAFEYATNLGLDVSRPKASVDAERETQALLDVDLDAAHLAAFPSGDPSYPGPLARKLQRFLTALCAERPDHPHRELALAVAQTQAVAPGSRDNAFALSTGWLVSQALHGLPEALHDPEGVYLVLVGLVAYVAELTDAETGAQDSGEPWASKALPKLAHYWAHDLKESQMVQDMRLSAAPPAPTLPQGPPEEGAAPVDPARLPPLLSMPGTGTTYLALQPDGTYSAQHGTINQAIGDLIRTGLADRYGIRYTPAGQTRPKILAVGTIQQEHLGAAVIGDDQVYPKLLDPTEGHPTFSPRRLLGPMRVELVEYGLSIRANTARYDPWVAEYLQQLPANEEGREILFSWLENFPRWFDRKLPMLILHGDPRTGKSLLTAALCQLAPSVQMEGSAGSSSYNHQIGLGVTLAWDDTLPVSGHRYADTLATIDYLLRLTLGQRMALRQKYRDEREVSRPWRLIHSYNSLQFAHLVFRSMPGAHEHARRSAVATRLTSVRVRNASREWVLKNPSPYDNETTLAAVAQHVQWMSENPTRVEGEDYTVERGGFVHLPCSDIERIAGQADESTIDHQEALIALTDCIYNTPLALGAKAPFGLFLDKGTVVVGVRVRHALAAMTDSTLNPEVKREVRHFLDTVTELERPEVIRLVRIDQASHTAVGSSEPMRVRILRMEGLTSNINAYDERTIKRLEQLSLNLKLTQDHIDRAMST